MKRYVLNIYLYYYIKYIFKYVYFNVFSLLFFVWKILIFLERSRYLPLVENKYINKISNNRTLYPLHLCLFYLIVIFLNEKGSIIQVWTSRHSTGFTHVKSSNIRRARQWISCLFGEAITVCGSMRSWNTSGIKRTKSKMYWWSSLREYCSSWRHHCALSLQHSDLRGPSVRVMVAVVLVFKSGGQKTAGITIAVSG